MPPPPLPSSSSQPALGDPFSLRTRSDSTTAPTREATVPLRDHEEALSRLRILERHQAEDRERLREFERLREEERTWKEVRTRLQAKMVEMQAELKTLRAGVREAVTERDAAQSRYADLADEVEMATLDKEVRAAQSFPSFSEQTRIGRGGENGRARGLGRCPQGTHRRARGRDRRAQARSWCARSPSLLGCLTYRAPR
jgi:hypothetical protein